MAGRLVPAAAFLAFACLQAQAADAVRGAQLYMRTDTDTRSCVSCHGPDPGLSHNNILRAAGNPAALTQVLNTVSSMGFLRPLLTDTDREDVAAFLDTVVRLNAAGAPLKVWPITGEFGAVGVGAPSAVQTVRIANVSGAAVPVGSLTASGTGLDLSHDCPAVLAPQAACEARLRLLPQATGMARGTLRLSSTALASPVLAGFAGSGAAGATSALAWVQAEPAVRMGATTGGLVRTLTLTNPGPNPAVLGTTSIVGPQAAQFRVERGCASGTVLQAGQQCAIDVAYTPYLLPQAQAALQVRSDQANPPSLRLEGENASIAEAAPAEGGGGCSVGPPGGGGRDPVLPLALLAAALAFAARGLRVR